MMLGYRVRNASWRGSDFVLRSAVQRVVRNTIPWHTVCPSPQFLTRQFSSMLRPVVTTLLATVPWHTPFGRFGPLGMPFGRGESRLKERAQLEVSRS